MNVLPNRWGIAGLVLGLSVSAAMAGVEEKIDLTDVPAEVMDVAEKYLKNLRLAMDGPITIDLDAVIDDNISSDYKQLGAVSIVSANTETEDDGSFVYEIQGKAADGRQIEIDIDPTARVEEIEIEFKREDVPGAVLKSVESKMPGFAPEFIEASHSASMQVVGYELVGKMGDEVLDIEVSADGRSITIADQ